MNETPISEFPKERQNRMKRILWQAKKNMLDKVVTEINAIKREIEILNNKIQSLNDKHEDFKIISDKINHLEVEIDIKEATSKLICATLSKIENGEYEVSEDDLTYISRMGY